MLRRIFLNCWFGWVGFAAGPAGWAEDSLVNEPNRREIAELASIKIDALIGDKLLENGQTRNPNSDDEIFVRRIYLDIIGRIPTIQESHAFLSSQDPDKRRNLIDQLLDSYGYVSHQFNYLADLLRIKTKHRNILGQPYIEFVKDSLESNLAYDKLARELIQSSGPMLERGNGSTGYYLRDLGMPEDNMSNTIRVFLGTRLECAQCHDHPYDRWTQRQYYEMLAFTGGMKMKSSGTANITERMNRVIRENELDVDRQTRRFVRRTLSPLTYNIQGSGNGLAQLPEGFLGDDGEEGEIVRAKTIFDDQRLVESEVPQKVTNKGRNRKKGPAAIIKRAKEVGSRDAFARWLTENDNPRFAKVIANRLWKRAMGVGLIEPVDILEDATVASNPELMQFLTELMIETGFDMKTYLRSIYYSKTYQAESYPADIGDPTKYHFPGPSLRRLTAEQIWDSLLTLTVNNIDKRKLNTAPRDLQYFGRDIYESFENVQELTDEEILEMARTLVESGPRGLRTLASESQMQQRDYRQQLGRKLKEVKQAISKAKRRDDEASLRRLIAMRTELTAEIGTTKSNSGLLRASELSSPAPAGHLLREFGQSDREEIENANLEPSVTQVLSLMNGYIEKQVIQNVNTVLIKNVIWQSEPEDKIKAVYLTILSRLPSEQETVMWLADVKRSKIGFSRDLIWTLVNSNEFLFNK